MSTKLLTQLRRTSIGPGWVLEGEKKRIVSAAPRKTVLFAVADHANDEGVCRLSMYTLVSETGWSYRTVRRALESLEKDGWIEREHRYGKRGFRVADEIRLVSPGSRPCVPRGQALEAPLRSVKSLALIGPDHPEENSMRIIDLRDEGASPYLDQPTKVTPTRPKAKKPDRWNPVTLADYTVYKFRQLQWGTPGAVTAKEFGGHYRRWHHDEGVGYREIKIAVDLFCEEWPGLDIPAGRLFLKQRFDWITKAKEAIYQEELPKKQAASKEMWRQIYADLAVWEADHPNATDTERSAEKAALYQYYRYSPESQFSSVYA